MHLWYNADRAVYCADACDRRSELLRSDFMIKAVIFDLDGTLMNTLYDLYVGVNRALSSCGYESVSIDKVRASVGNGVAKLVARCLPEVNKEEFTRVLERFNREYALCKDDHTAPYDGAVQAMQKLKSAGVKIAVVSNKTESAVKALCAEKFSGLYDLAVGDDGVRPLKPSPEPIQYALSALNVKKEEAVYVGDQEVDVKTASNSGLRLLGAGWGFRGKRALEAAGATCVCEDFGKLTEIVLKNDII